MRAILRAISIRPGWPTEAMRRARRTISSRSSSVNCRNLVPRSTWSRCSATNRETLDSRNPTLALAVDDEPAGDQALAPPPRDGPGRYVEFPAHRVDGEDRLGDLGRVLAHGAREVLDEGVEVVTDVVAVEHQGRRVVRAEAGDPEADVLVRVRPARVDLRQQDLGAVDLLDPLLLGGESRLLVAKLPQRRMVISLAHPCPPSACLAAIPTVAVARGWSSAEPVARTSCTLNPMQKSRPTGST